MEWAKEEIDMRVYSIPHMMCDDSAGVASNSSHTAGVLQRTRDTFWATPRLGLKNGAAPSLQALLAAVCEPQRAVLQRMSWSTTTNRECEPWPLNP